MNEINSISNCPFCDGEATLTEQNICGGHGCFYTKYYVKCKNCHAQGPSTDDYAKKPNIQEIVKKWNEAKR